MKSSTIFKSSYVSIRNGACLLFAALTLSGCQQIADVLGGPDEIRFRANPNLIPAPEPTPLSCDPAKIAEYGGGDGSINSPYTLCSVEQWKHLTASPADWNLNFKLESDLDFVSFNATNFASVGSVTDPFTGVLDGNDGNGKKISNLTLNGLNQVFALFRQTDQSAEIKNLKLSYFSLTSEARMAALVLDHGTGGTLTLANIEISHASIVDNASGIISGVGLVVGSSSGPVQLLDSGFTDISLSYSGNSRDSGGIIGNSTSAVRAERISVVDLTLTKSAWGSLDYHGGFIGSILADGSIFRDVTMTNLFMDTGSGAGGIAARVYGGMDLDRVHVAGSITSGGGQSGLVQELGAFSGLVQELGAFSGTPSVNVTDSSFVGTLGNAGNSSYGGLLGTVFMNLSIRRSFHEGPLAVWSGSVGGLVGQAGGAGLTALIEDSYSRGVTTTTHATQGRASGLIGVNAGGTTTIRRSYAARSNAGTATPGKSCIVDNITGTVVLEDVHFDSTLCTGSADHNTVLTGATSAASSSFYTNSAFANWSTAVWEFSLTGYPTIKR